MKIMVGLRPGEHNTPALERAVAIAKREPAELLLFSAIYDEHIAGIRFGLDEEMVRLQEAARTNELAELRSVADSVAEDFTRVGVKTCWHYPASEAITEAAATFGADLLILAASEHSALGRLFVTSTDWDVMRTAGMPVLLARGANDRPYQTLMVAVDPTQSHDEPAALDYKLINSARHLARPFKAEVFLAHAAPSMASLITGDYVPTAEDVASLQQKHADATLFLAEQVGIDAAYVRLENDVPRWAIPRMAAELDADVVVLGSVSRSFLSRLLIGKTTEGVVGALDCDVLVVAADAP